MNTSTLRSKLSAAEICRLNGWVVGTRLVGNEGYGPTVIEITAIGFASILARTLSHKNDTTHRDRENSWVLWCRDWVPEDWKDYRCICGDSRDPVCRYHRWKDTQDDRLAKRQQKGTQ